MDNKDFYGWMLIDDWCGVPPHTICGQWCYDFFSDEWESKGSRYPACVCKKLSETSKSRWREAENALIEREQEGRCGETERIITENAERET